MPGPLMTDATEAVRRLLLRVPKRRRVFEAVVACPGTHARRLSRDLGMALGVVEHHVRHLERHGLVFAHQAGRRRTLYASGHVDADDARVIHLLRKPVLCRLLALVGATERSLPSLAHAAGLPVGNVAYHLRRLRAAGLVDQVRAGREVAYLGRDPARVGRLLAALRPDVQEGFPDAAFAGLVARALPHTPARGGGARPGPGAAAVALSLRMQD